MNKKESAQSGTGIAKSNGADGDPIQTQKPHRRTPQELMQMANAWVRRTGWPTWQRDEAIGASVYQRWIDATNAEWATTHSRDFDLLAEMIQTAFTGIHDEEGIDAMQILLAIALVMRAREEGKLVRRRIH